MRLRLVSYNVMNGGEGRADPLAEVIAAQRPDVVGLHEATDPAVLRRLAGRLKMDLVVAECDGGGAVALLSRLPILHSTNLAALHGSENPMLSAALDVGPDDPSFVVRVHHLRSFDAATRMAEQLDAPEPAAMLSSLDPPLGVRWVDGRLVRAMLPLPTDVRQPVRQVDQVMVIGPARLISERVETDRMATYASDHYPAVAEVETS